MRSQRTKYASSGRVASKRTLLEHGEHERLHAPAALVPRAVRRSARRPPTASPPRCSAPGTARAGERSHIPPLSSGGKCARPRPSRPRVGTRRMTLREARVRVRDGLVREREGRIHRSLDAPTRRGLPDTSLDVRARVDADHAARRSRLRSVGEPQTRHVDRGVTPASPAPRPIPGCRRTRVRSAGRRRGRSRDARTALTAWAKSSGTASVSRGRPHPGITRSANRTSSSMSSPSDNSRSARTTNARLPPLSKKSRTARLELSVLASERTLISTKLVTRTGVEGARLAGAPTKAAVDVSTPAIWTTLSATSTLPGRLLARRLLHRGRPQV